MFVHDSRLNTIWDNSCMWWKLRTFVHVWFRLLSKTNGFYRLSWISSVHDVNYVLAPTQRWLLVISRVFVPHDTMLARYMSSSCVCLSVTLRYCNQMAKRRITHMPRDSPRTLAFAKDHDEIRTGSPPSEETNASGWVKTFQTTALACYFIGPLWN